MIPEGLAQETRACVCVASTHASQWRAFQFQTLTAGVPFALETNMNDADATARAAAGHAATVRRQLHLHSTPLDGRRDRSVT